MALLLKRAFLVILLTAFVYTGIMCNSCPDNCQNCVNSDTCTECKASKWGIGSAQCNNDCDKRCLNDECHDDTGYCVKCEIGKFGRLCQYNCSLCMNDRCNLYDCTERCKYGYYTYQTDEDYLCLSCQRNCKQCVDCIVCHVCDDGFYLSILKSQEKTLFNCIACANTNDCSDFCFINGCSQCKVIDHEAKCTDCQEDEIFNGDTCVQNKTPCSQKCSTNCDNNGICLGNCTDGWTGENCSEKCNDKCLKCTKEDKNNCTHCKDDFYSSNCSLSCNQFCVKEQDSQTCSFSNGLCLIGCHQGYWGKKCDKSCSDRCITCDRINGRCSGHCKIGFMGTMCNQTSTLETTDKSSPTTSSAIQKVIDKDNDFIIGLFSGIGISVAIALIVALVFLLRRRYARNKQQRSDSDNDNSLTYQNTRTDFQGIKMETENFPNNYESLRTNRQKDHDYSDLRATRQ